MLWFHKLGFCSISLNATLALVGQVYKKLQHVTISSVSISALPIHTCMRQWHAIMLLHLFFHSSTESHQVSLNHILRWLSTGHKSSTVVRIDESLTLLVSWHMRIHIGGGLSILFSFPSDYIVHWFHKLGFFSVSLNATIALVGQCMKPSTVAVLVGFLYHPFPCILTGANDM